VLLAVDSDRDILVAIERDLIRRMAWLGETRRLSRR
jgi:hypothetical protein